MSELKVPWPNKNLLMVKYKKKYDNPEKNKNKKPWI